MGAGAEEFYRRGGRKNIDLVDFGIRIGGSPTSYGAWLPIRCEPDPIVALPQPT